MKNKDNAIEVENLTKEFLLRHQKKQTLKGLFLNKFQTKSYEKLVVVKNLSLTVKKGDFLGIIGPNGAGKSTLLKIISGIYLPTHGSVKVNGKISPFIELTIGFQPELSAKDNVYLYGAVLGLSKKEIDSKYNEIVEFSELKKFMDQQYKLFSSGMQLRLAFSVTSLTNSDILLVDEALAVGDQSFLTKCLKKMAELNKSGCTILFVSHHMELVQKICKRVVWMENGSTTGKDIPPNVMSKYVATFRKSVYGIKK